MPSKPDVAPNVTSLDLLRSLYQELSAPFIPYYKSIIRISWRDGSPDTEEVVTHGPEGVPEKFLNRSNYRGAKAVTVDRTFVEETCGSLYAPVSALGYRSFDYPWALAFKIDADIARMKTGDPVDGMAEYVSDVAADDKILKRRMILKKASNAGRPGKTNTQDLEERYLEKMKNISTEDRKEIAAFLKKNRRVLDSATDSFRHEDYKSRTDAYSISLSAGPEDLDQENFLSWLLEQADGSRRVARKLALDEFEPNVVKRFSEKKKKNNESS